MPKVRVSYKGTEEKIKSKIIEALKPLGITKISKEQEKPGHKNVYIDLKGD